MPILYYHYDIMVITVMPTLNYFDNLTHVLV